MHYMVKSITLMLMKVRRFKALGLLATYVFASLLGALAPFDKPALAADTVSGSYVFYYPSDGTYISKLNSDVKSEGTGGATLNRTKVYAKGGPFKSPVAMAYDSDASSKAQASQGAIADGDPEYGAHNDGGVFTSGDKTLYVYKLHYYCQNGKGQIGAPTTDPYYEITYAVTLQLKGKLDDQTTVPLRFATYPQAVHYETAAAGKARDPIKLSKASDIPNSCRPIMLGGMNGMRVNTTAAAKFNGDSGVKIPNYSKDPKKLAEIWGNLDKADGNGDAGGGNGGGEDDSCEANATGGLAWLICPTLNIINTATGFFQDFVEEQLKVDILNNTSSDPIHQVWSNFRNLADVLFVLVFLFFIFAQLLRINLDAYAIKKIIPKLVAAAVLVQFSFLLSGVLIDIGNIVGGSIASLFDKVTTIPMGGGGDAAVKSVSGGISVILAGGLAVGVVSALGAAGAIALGLTAFFAVATVVITLLMRKIIIQILVVLSPLAFVAFVFPGTEKFFKIWLQNFIKIIIMYPLIVLMFSAASLVSAVNGANANAASFGFGNIFAAIMPIIVCFLVPQTYKWGGGMMGAASGYVNQYVGGAGKKVKSGWNDSSASKALRQNRADRKTVKTLKAEEAGGLRGYMAGVKGRGDVLGGKNFKPFSAIRHGQNPFQDSLEKQRRRTGDVESGRQTLEDQFKGMDKGQRMDQLEIAAKRGDTTSAMAISRALLKSGQLDADGMGHFRTAMANANHTPDQVKKAFGDLKNADYAGFAKALPSYAAASDDELHDMGADGTLEIGQATAQKLQGLSADTLHNVGIDGQAALRDRTKFKSATTLDIGGGREVRFAAGQSVAGTRSTAPMYDTATGARVGTHTSVLTEDQQARMTSGPNAAKVDDTKRETYGL